MEDISLLLEESARTPLLFLVQYLGSMSMDRLYSQSMQPWVMAEIRRRKRNTIEEVIIEVGKETLRVSKRVDNTLLFEHHLKGVTRFAKLHQDPHCFAYLTRYKLNADFQCHVYLASGDEMVSQLFIAIRDASKDIPTTVSQGQQPISMGEEASGQSRAVESICSKGEKGRNEDHQLSMFEVKYLGRAKVRSKRVTAEYIDLLAEKMIAREEDWIIKRLTEVEEEKKKKREEELAEEDRKRHASGASVKSLPEPLDFCATDLTMENKLGKQKEKLKQRESVVVSPEMPSTPGATSHSSSENVASHTLAAECQGHFYQPMTLQGVYHSDSDSSRDNLASSEEHLPDLSDKLQQTSQLSSVTEHMIRRRHSSQKEEGLRGSRTTMQDFGHQVSADSEDSVGSICRQLDASRIMVLQIGTEDLALISLDKKAAILQCKFRDISFVSQGSHKQDLFGIVAREIGNSFICYVLKCLSDLVVCEIMNTLQMAFTVAYAKKGGQTMSSATGGSSPATGTQLQVCTLCPLHQLHRLCQEINALTPQAAYDLLVKKVQQLQEQEVCEINQRMQIEAPQSLEESVEVMMIYLHQVCQQKQKQHIHISEGNKSDIHLLEERPKLLEGLRNKAKKSLTASFETLLNMGKKKDDLGDGFRQRSWTTDSDTSWLSKDSSTCSSTPDMSPMSREFQHQFSSPPSSPAPVQRQRSATMDSLGTAAGAKRGDVNHNTKTSSPGKTIFFTTTTSSPQHSESISSSCVSSPLEDPTLLASPRRPSSSWRKAIFNRVCTPQHSIDLGEDSSLSESSQAKLHSTVDIRAMWKKAILETLLLIRMEKENHNIRAHQEEGGIPLSRKLEYQELTPCLKEITSVWEKVLALHDGQVLEEIGGQVLEEEKAIPSAKLLEYVKKGVPRTLRGQIWLFLMQQRQMSSTVADSSTCDIVNYEDLLKQLTTHQHAILIDLGRTFPCHPYFSKALGPGQLELFNLLKAYSLLDQEVGYCQGLSFIVGMLLMHMEEISAFHVLKYMMYDLGLRKQFRPNMMALQIKLYQLTRLLHDHCKDVYQHFEAHEISPTLYAAPWFLTLFASQFPLGFVARVFDMLFVQGIDAMFKVALMLIASHHALILQCDTFESIVDFLKTTLPEMVQVQMERIINQAFELDIKQELQAYEVEYHVLKEEMLYLPPQQQQHNRQFAGPYSHNQTKTASSSPNSCADRPSRLLDRRSSIDLEMIYRLEHQNRALKNQNMELLEKLQNAQSQHRSFESIVQAHQIELDKLKSHIRVLELERAALLTAVATMQTLAPPEALTKLNLSLNLPECSPEASSTAVQLQPWDSSHQARAITNNVQSAKLIGPRETAGEKTGLTSKATASAEKLVHATQDNLCGVCRAQLSSSPAELTGKTLVPGALVPVVDIHPSSSETVFSTISVNVTTSPASSQLPSSSVTKSKTGTAKVTTSAAAVACPCDGRQVYSPRSICVSGAAVAATGVVSVEERRKAVKVTVQQSPLDRSSQKN